LDGFDEVGTGEDDVLDPVTAQQGELIVKEGKIE
jgi:hypothetical protein